jgi:hypothetical protein
MHQPCFFISTPWATALRIDRIAAGFWIYPAIEPVASVIDYHHDLYTSGSQSAEDGFAGLAAAHRLFTGSAPNQD